MFQSGRVGVVNKEVVMHPSMTAYWYYFEIVFMASHEECFLLSPKLRMSFITYSTFGQTLLKLTSKK